MNELIQKRLARALTTTGPTRAIRTHSGTVLGSDIGIVRKRNEDCCLIVKAVFAGHSRRNFTVAVVCDGLGGMRQGREAAIIAASTFIATLVSIPSGQVCAFLSEATERANEAVFQKLRGDGGTTLSAVVTSQHDGTHFCHVGDSRIYGVLADRRVKQLSRDDTMSAALQKQEISDEAPKDSRLLQFVGMGEELETQVAQVPAEYKSVLLTSDGAHDVPPSVFQRLVTAATGGTDLIRKLLTMSDTLGGKDNASAILLPVGGESDLYDEFLDNELVAILPNETLSIYFADMKITSPEKSLRNSPFENAPTSHERQNDNGVVKARKSAPAKATLKGKLSQGAPGARSKSGKAKKAQPEMLLPLEAAGAAVDVQFSSPASPGENEKP